MDINQIILYTEYINKSIIKYPENIIHYSQDMFKYYVLPIKDTKIHIHRYDSYPINEKYTFYKFGINDKIIHIDEKCIELSNLWISIEMYHKNIKRLISVIQKYLNIELDESKERIEEFEIIKNDCIDYISLNTLFDFFNIEFNESLIKKELN